MRVGKPWLIPFTLLGAWLLSAIPLSGTAAYLRPDFVGVAVFFWALQAPSIFGVTWAWVIGLVIDVQLGTLLGQHALGYAFVAYFANHQFIRTADIVQQTLVASAVIWVKQFIVLNISGITGHLPPNALLYFAPTLWTFVLYPWLHFWLHDNIRTIGSR